MEISTSRIRNNKGFTLDVYTVGKFGILAEAYKRNHWFTIVLNFLIFEIVLTIYFDRRK